MNVIDAIRTKRAIREFSNRPLPDEIVLAILDAGRRAQSSKNTQPWQFVVVRDRHTLKELSECGTYAGHLAGAALGVALVRVIDASDFDMGQAAAYMQLAAWDLGVVSCLASIYDPVRAKKALGIPEAMHFDRAISFGYPLDKPAAQKPRKGGRKSMEQVVRWEKW